jgi:hypothetical protein
MVDKWRPEQIFELFVSSFMFNLPVCSKNYKNLPGNLWREELTCVVFASAIPLNLKLTTK